MTAEILSRMTTEVGATSRQIAAVEKLLADGNTIPFIARYRKEAHGNLDEVAIGKIKDRLEYYNELEARKETVLKSIEEQGKLTDELRAAIAGCFVKSRLEDIYQPYKPKRRTRAQVAKEKGYEPLADAMWEGEELVWNGGEPTDEDLQLARGGLRRLGLVVAHEKAVGRQRVGVVPEKDHGSPGEELRVDVVVFAAAIDDRADGMPKVPQLAHEACRRTLFDHLHDVSAPHHDVTHAGELLGRRCLCGGLEVEQGVHARIV